MTEIDFYEVDSDYGPKIAVDFEYDERIVGKIQRLRNEQWEVTHCSAVYEDDEFQYWTIDPDQASIDRFESVVGVRVPGEFKDVDRDEEIEITVPDGYSWYFIQNPTGEIDRILDTAFSYEVEDAKYNTAVQRGAWDGIEHIYSTDHHGAPVGLLDRTIQILEDEGFDVSVERESKNVGAEAKFEWLFKHDLRPYQSDAITEVLMQDGGIVGLPTGTGKTIVALKLAEMLGRKAIVFVHTQELLYQWADEIREVLGVEPGLIGDGQWTEGAEITVAIMDTLESRGTDGLDDDYGVVFFDECHRTSAAETFHKIGMSLDCYYRIGLSATPWRAVDGEELKIEGAVGGVAHTVTAESMIESGYLAEPVFETLNPSEYGSPAASREYEKYHEAYERRIEFDPVRNLAIAKKAKEMADDGRQVLVNVSRISQAYLLGSALNTQMTVDDVASHTDDDKVPLMRACHAQMGMSTDADALVVTSETPDSERREAIEAFENGEYEIMISTVVKEGVDIPSINGIILAHGQKSDIETIQVIGRALRANGGKAKIVDVADVGGFFGSAHSVRQQTMDRYYGSYGPTGGTEESPMIQTS